MRVIAGECRSMPLKAPRGTDTRPTQDITKETLFNVLQNDIYDAKFADLFAGSGAIGIEALSRGAKSAVFVENKKEALSVIKDNLSFTKLANRATVMECDVLFALERLKNSEPFDIIFMDPPYKDAFEVPVFNILKDAKCVSEYTKIVCEADKETDFSFLEQMGFEIIKEKKYKTSKHVFVRRK